MSVLIPIAIHRDTGEWMEVSEAKQGKDCGCICPSCGQTLVARHGEINAWHFAHDHTSARPDKDCNLSFYSCCRAYLIDLFRGGDIQVLTTPGLSHKEPVSPYEGVYVEGAVTDPARLTGWTLSEPFTYDVSLNVGPTLLHLQFIYPNRTSDISPSDPRHGLLSIDLVGYQEAFYAIKGQRRPLRNFLVEMLGEEVNFKSWAHHPRSERVLQKLLEDARRKAKELRGAEQLRGTFECLRCKDKWEGLKIRDAICSRCNTTLYSCFVAKSGVVHRFGRFD